MGILATSVLFFAIFKLGAREEAEEPPCKKRHLEKRKHSTPGQIQDKENRGKRARKLARRQRRFDANYLWYLKGCKEGKTTFRFPPINKTQECLLFLFNARGEVKDVCDWEASSINWSCRIVAELNEEQQHRALFTPEEPYLDTEWQREIDQNNAERTQSADEVAAKYARINAILKYQADFVYQEMLRHEDRIFAETTRGKTYAWLLAPGFGNEDLKIEETRNEPVHCPMEKEED